MNIQKIQDMLIAHEGLKLKLYRCTENKLTVGIGRNLESRGITKNEALYLLGNDIRLCAADLPSVFSGFTSLPENVKMVLMDMRFQLGPNRFRKFKNMIRAVKNHDWPEMIKQMKDSRWYRQVPNRAHNLIKLVQVLID